MSDFPEEKVVPRVIEDEMKQSYLDYAMSVIVGRALPDARDGLKPVHRRILYAMNDLGMKHTGSFKKCARIVGEVLGKYHPHGDSAVYDSLVRMAQEWSLRYPLVFGQGNFGSTDGDNPAAMRYTEAKLQKISNEILEDIDKETVSFSENFDGSLQEPDVLPSKFANMLINGSSGIAVGMATNIAPHNLTEVAHAVIELINNPEAEVSDLMQHVSGPDFPTSGRIMGRSEIMRAYKTGKGKIIVRGVLHREEVANRERVVITEIPYQVNKSALVEEIANLVKDKRVDGITDIRDESDRKGIRVVIECRKNANLDVLENQLFKMSRLQVTFGINTVALVEGEPKLLGLKEALEVFLKHRYGVVRARTAYDLKKAEARHHILLGLVKALNDIDRCVQLIKKAKSVTEAREALKKAYDLSDEQAQAILDMRLQKLTSLEQNKIREELEELEALIKELKSILDSDERIYGIIKQEQEDLIETYGDERRTKISDEELSGVEDEDLIESEDQVVTLSHAGYVKRLPIETYRTQKRGGKGVIGMTTKEEDFVEQLFIANTHDFLLAFTNNGRLHWLKTYKIPEAARQAKGKAIVNLLELPEGEKVKALIPVKEFVEGNFLVKCTKNGVIKKTSLAAYSNPRKGGIISMGLRDGDELVEVKLTKGNQEILIATKQGMAVRFQEGAVRAMGRSATGVRGIKLKKNDEVIGMIAASSESKILSITEKGYGKKSQVADYRLTNRGGSGVRNVKVTDKTGIVVVVKSVTDDDELILASENGIVIRTSSGEISTIGRNTQGVRVMRLGEGDKVVSVGVIRE